MAEGCQNQSCPNWHGAMQHNCSLGHTEFCQCPDRFVAPDSVFLKTEDGGGREPVKVHMKTPLDGEAVMHAPQETVTTEVTLMRTQVHQGGKVIATWYEDEDGNVYKPV